MVPEPTLGAGCDVVYNSCEHIRLLLRQEVHGMLSAVFTVHFCTIQVMACADVFVLRMMLSGHVNHNHCIWSVTIQ